MDNESVSLRVSDVQRCLVNDILQVRCRTGPDEFLNEFGVIVIGGGVKGSPGSVVFRVFIGALFDQERNDLEMASNRCALKF